MPRVMPESRLQDLIEAATRVFIESRGYERAQMADVARALGLSKASVYACVESKEALFDLALRYADHPEDTPTNAPLPIPSRGPGETLRFIQEQIRTDALFREVSQRLSRRKVVDASMELRELLRTLYDLLDRHKTTLKLLERCALDHPSLADVWRSMAREGLLLQLERFIGRRIREGYYAQDMDARVAGRFVLETCVFWAMHRHWDAIPATYDNCTARDTAISLVSRSLLAAAP